MSSQPLNGVIVSSFIVEGSDAAWGESVMGMLEKQDPATLASMQPSSDAVVCVHSLHPHSEQKMFGIIMNVRVPTDDLKVLDQNKIVAPLTIPQRSYLVRQVRILFEPCGPHRRVKIETNADFFGLEAVRSALGLQNGGELTVSLERALPKTPDEKVPDAGTIELSDYFKGVLHSEGACRMGYDLNDYSQTRTDLRKAVQFEINVKICSRAQQFIQTIIGNDRNAVNIQDHLYKLLADSGISNTCMDPLPDKFF